MFLSCFAKNHLSLCFECFELGTFFLLLVKISSDFVIFYKQTKLYDELTFAYFMFHCSLGHYSEKWKREKCQTKSGLGKNT